jgi:3',5'-cyclic AMP phosphodiesterase CpdA
MPITLLPVTRRRFLQGSLAVAAASFSVSELYAEGELPLKNDWAVLADIHIAGDPKKRGRMNEKNLVDPLENFRKARTDILSGEAGQPCGVLVCGDCAFNEGKPDDYEILLKEFAPFREAGLSIQFLMGNHDNRKAFLEAVATAEGKKPPVSIPHRLHSVLETPKANLFLLDSAQWTNNTPGLLGREQIDWIVTELDARRDKPAIMIAHHYPDFFRTRNRHPNPIQDTYLFFDRLLPRKQAKAYMFGHSHIWRLDRHEDIHLVNFPTTAWRNDLSQPRGWVFMTLKENGVSLKLRSIDPEHPKHNETVELTWR